MGYAILRGAVPSPLRQQVVDILRKAITECVFEPGGRLIERELCEMLGVSRTTLREGLRQLHAEGLLDLAPNKGPTIPILSLREAASVYAVRAELEGFACALCAENASSRDLSALAGHLGAMTSAMSDDDFKMMQQAKTAFFDHLYEASGNSELKQMLRRLRARVTLIRGLNVNRAARAAEAVAGAKAILAALAARDAAAARKAGQRHIDKAAALALAAMRGATEAKQEADLRRPRLRTARWPPDAPRGDIES